VLRVNELTGWLTLLGRGIILVLTQRDEFSVRARVRARGG
jgi:hypothetical protein